MKSVARHISRLVAFGLTMTAGGVLAAQYPYYGYPHPGGYGYAPMPGTYPPPPPMYGMPQPYSTPQMPYGRTPGQSQPSAQNKPTAQQPSEQISDSASVSIGKMRFSPSVVTVQKGAKVTWKQADKVPHTVTATDNSFSSPRLTMNGEFSHVFDQPGTYTYYCTIHPSMRGEIRVVE
jgi:plastocyanin